MSTSKPAPAKSSNANDNGNGTGADDDEALAELHQLAKEALKQARLKASGNAKKTRLACNAVDEDSTDASRIMRVTARLTRPIKKVIPD